MLWLSLRPFKSACFCFWLVLGLLAASSSVYATSEKVIYAFNPNVSANPAGGLINVGGTLYGTTSGFMTQSTIFKVTPGRKIHTVATFTDNFGYSPTLLAAGKLLYGVINEGGDPKCYCGYVFSATEKGEITILHTFTGGSDGASPSGSLIELGGVLYGTTSFGGPGTCSEETTSGCGTVFAITPQGAYTQIYAFQGPAAGDGANPGELLAVNGALYGTTGAGGTAANQAFSGTLFSLSIQGAETVLHSFGVNKKDGNEPGGLLLVGATLYGTTAFGGSGNFGIAYSIGLDGSNEKILHTFINDNVDGLVPGDLIAVNGLFYGTTSSGGNDGDGTVFSLTKAGVETIVYSFQGINKQLGIHDALEPNGPLLYVGGSFYGTSEAGGRLSRRGCFTGSCGTVFEVTP